MRLPKIPESLRPRNLFSLAKDDGGKRFERSHSPFERVLADRSAATPEPAASDLGKTSLYLPGLYDQQLSALIQQRVQDGLAHRRPHEAAWIESLSAYNGDAWQQWDDKAGKLVNKARALQPTQHHRSYVNHPLIKSRGRKLIARALTNSIGFSFAPHSDLPQDREAAEEVRCAFEHIQSINDWPALTFEASRQATVFCPQYVVVHVDPKCDIDLPLWDIAEDGQPFMREIVRGVGPEIKLCRLTSFDIIGDMRQKDVAKWKWFAREVYMTYGDIRERWPEMADYICTGSSGQQATSGASGQSMIRGVNRDIPFNATPSGSQGAWMIEYWECPSPMYPEGRIVFMSDGGVIAEQCKFPPGLKRLPIVQVAYEKGIDSQFGQSALQPALSAQYHYNEGMSAVLDRSREHGKLLAKTGAGIKHDAMQSGLGYEVVFVNGEANESLGSVVQYIQPPTVDPSVVQLIQQSRADLDDILEVNDVSRGIMPSGVTSGAAFNAMTASDQSSGTLFRENLKSAYQELGEIILALLPEVYADQSRVLSMSDTAPSAESDMPEIEMMRQMTAILSAAGVPGPEIARLLLPDAEEYATDQDIPGHSEAIENEEPKIGRAKSRAFIFAHLAAGRVTVTADVKMVKSPQQRVADLMQMAQSGFFAPENLETSLVLLEQMGFEESDRVTRRLTTALRRILAERQKENPDPAQIAQEQADAQIKVQTERIAAETASKLALGQQAHENAMEELMASGKSVLTPEQTAILMQSVVVPPPTDAFAAFQSAVGTGEPPQDPTMPTMPEGETMLPFGPDAPPDASSGGLQIPGGEE